jgi:FkbM family methyltransferase
MKSLLRRSVNLLPIRSRGWIRHIPLLGFAQRWLVNNVISGEAFVHTINAGPARRLRFEVTLPEDKAIWAGMFEPEFSNALHNAVRIGDVCYDIGGYRGYMSGVFALAGASKVIVFEPLPANVAQLKRLRELNPALPLQIEELAVGKTDGQVHFKVMPDQSMGKLANSAFQATRSALHEIPVWLARLDTCVFERGLPKPNVIKIDVEGAEVDVLDGAIRMLKECRPEILIEAHSESLASQCSQRLMMLGYDVRQLEKGNVESQQPRHLLARSKQ